MKAMFLAKPGFSLYDTKYKGTIGNLIAILQQFQTVYTSPELYKECKKEKIKAVEFISENINEAFEYGFTHAEENGLLCCAGSLYLVGAIKKHVLNGNNIEKFINIRGRMGI